MERAPCCLSGNRHIPILLSNVTTSWLYGINNFAILYTFTTLLCIPKQYSSTLHLLRFSMSMCVCYIISVLSDSFATLRTVACQASLSMGFPRPEYWSGLPFPSPGDLPNPGIEPESFMSPALAFRFFTTCASWEAPYMNIIISICSMMSDFFGSTLCLWHREDCSCQGG